MAKRLSSFMRVVPEPVLTELGRVIAAWAHIEQSFDLLYLRWIVMQGAAIGATTNPRIKMMGQAFARRVREFRQFIDTLSLTEERRTAWDRALSQLISLRRKRDKLAHSVIGAQLLNEHIKQDSIVAVFKSWRNSKPHEFEPVSLDDLETTFGEMDRLYWNLFEIKFHRDSFGSLCTSG